MTNVRQQNQKNLPPSQILSKPYKEELQTQEILPLVSVERFSFCAPLLLQALSKVAHKSTYFICLLNIQCQSHLSSRPGERKRHGSSLVKQQE